MKRSIAILAAILLVLPLQVNGQGSLLKKVAGAMKDELLGTTGKSSANKDPEPASACSDAELVVNLGGKLSLDYKELTISTMDDGSLLMQDRISGNFFIATGGNILGPYQPGDSRIAGYENSGSGDNNSDTWTTRYKGIITKTGDKYVINFGGKTYGPYATISSFAMPKTKDKFAAVVTENMVITESEGKKMDQAIKNAKTDQEKTQLALQYSQQMQQKIMSGGGPESITPKFVTNIPDVSYNPTLGGTLNGNMKYDDILVSKYDKVVDLKGKDVISIKPEHSGIPDIFVASDNSRYAYTNYGSLMFSNSNTPLSDIINPHLIKTGGSVYIAYMYYSPKKNSIMQCKIAF